MYESDKKIADANAVMREVAAEMHAAVATESEDALDLCDLAARLEAAATVRACIDCGVLISGGPTRCVACVRRMEAKTEPLKIRTVNGDIPVIFDPKQKESYIFHGTTAPVPGAAKDDRAKNQGIDWAADVLSFMTKFQQSTRSSPIVRHSVERLKWIDEELTEVKLAAGAKDIAGVADGIADTIYTLIGMALEWGIDLRPVWDEVHRSNMAKTGGGEDSKGKILKPAGWTPPDIVGALKKSAL